jgi:PhnB protein
MKKVSSTPKGFQTLTPYLIVDEADEFIEFLKNAFGGELTFEHRDDNNYIVHATVKIGSSIVMIGDAMKEMKPTNAMLYLYTEDADAMFKRATNARATVERELRDEFYGDRTGAVKDRWGNIWWIATHVEDVAKDELEKRGRTARKQQAEEMAH